MAADLMAEGWNRKAGTVGLGGQVLLQPLEPGGRPGRKIAARHRPVVAIRRVGLGREHPPEQHERAGYQRELSRAKQNQAGDLLVLNRAKRLVERVVS